MSQIIITGTPRFEDVKFLVDMLPESDRQISYRKFVGFGNSTDSYYPLRHWLFLLK